MKFIATIELETDIDNISDAEEYLNEIISNGDNTYTALVTEIKQDFHVHDYQLSDIDERFKRYTCEVCGKEYQIERKEDDNSEWKE